MTAGFVRREKKATVFWVMTKGVLALAGAALAATGSVATVIVAHAYIVRPRQVDGLNDLVGVLLPIAPPVVALLFAVLLWTAARKNPVARGIVWGGFCASMAYTLLQAWNLLTEYELIRQDGTTYWVTLQLPVVWIALPLLVTAIGIGALAGWLTRRNVETLDNRETNT